MGANRSMRSDHGKGGRGAGRHVTILVTWVLKSAGVGLRWADVARSSPAGFGPNLFLPAGIVWRMTAKPYRLWSAQDGWRVNAQT